jgi:hypothetical protein
MPRLRIIVLDQLPQPGSVYRVALWADVPAGRQSFYASPTRVSAWTAALAADNTALQNGSVTERVEVYNAAPGKNLAAIKLDLQSLWTTFQAAITAFNPWSHFSTTWDGTTWVDAGAT